MLRRVTTCPHKALQPKRPVQSRHLTPQRAATLRMLVSGHCEAHTSIRRGSSRAFLVQLEPITQHLVQEALIHALRLNPVLMSTKSDNPLQSSAESARTIQTLPQRKKGTVNGQISIIMLQRKASLSRQNAHLDGLSQNEVNLCAFSVRSPKRM